MGEIEEVLFLIPAMNRGVNGSGTRGIESHPTISDGVGLGGFGISELLSGVTNGMQKSGFS